MVGRGKGKASHDVIDVPFFSVGKEDQAVAILTYVNGFWDELIFRDSDHIEVSVVARHRGRVLAAIQWFLPFILSIL